MRLPFRREIDEPADTAQERAIRGADRQSGSTQAAGRDRRQRLGVSRRLTSHRHRRIVAAMLALLADSRDPPDAGMEEEQGLGDRLQKVHGIVAPANVRQFVSNQGFDMVRRNAGQDGHGEQDDRTHPAEDGGSIDER